MREFGSEEEFREAVSAAVYPLGFRQAAPDLFHADAAKDLVIHLRMEGRFSLPSPFIGVVSMPVNQLALDVLNEVEKPRLPVQVRTPDGRPWLASIPRDRSKVVYRMDLLETWLRGAKLAMLAKRPVDHWRFFPSEHHEEQDDGDEFLVTLARLAQHVVEQSASLTSLMHNSQLGPHATTLDAAAFALLGDRDRFEAVAQKALEVFEWPKIPEGYEPTPIEKMLLAQIRNAPRLGGDTEADVRAYYDTLRTRCFRMG